MYVIEMSRLPNGGYVGIQKLQGDEGNEVFAESKGADSGADEGHLIWQIARSCAVQQLRPPRNKSQTVLLVRTRLMSAGVHPALTLINPP
jgi:hypothetical protein